ncbi:MAG: hypothetical protein KGJ60_02930 [Verrucomicrobiota bacterium]|nr:hypothetical protein [Verrucomicrobiota bacterium]
MFIYQSRFLIRGEVWFDDEQDDAPVDWIYYRQRPSPVARARSKCFYTLLIDLAKSPEQLRSETEEKTVQKIEAAEKNDRTRWERCEPEDPKIMDEVERMWNESAAARNSAPLDRPWVNKLIEAGALELSATKDAAGRVLTYHLSYVGKNRAQDLIVVSPSSALPNTALRSRINRANCLGHWQTMLALKGRGLRHYDFGGWYPGNTNVRLLGMNAFKKGFGGQVVREFDCQEIRTVKGWIVLTAARMFQRVRLLHGTGGRGTSRLRNPENQIHAAAKNCEVSPAF